MTKEYYTRYKKKYVKFVEKNTVYEVSKYIKPNKNRKIYEKTLFIK